jgi:hypothetical protein
MKNYESTKLLIELSSSVEEADGYIENFIEFPTYGKKYNFLVGMFGMSQKIVSRQVPEGQSIEEIEKDSYFYLLHSIISNKRR